MKGAGHAAGVLVRSYDLRLVVPLVRFHVPCRSAIDAVVCQLPVPAAHSTGRVIVGQEPVSPRGQVVNDRAEIALSPQLIAALRPLLFRRGAPPHPSSCLASKPRSMHCIQGMPFLVCPTWWNEISRPHNVR